MADYCMTIVCPPAAEERLLDLLLTTEGTGVFTSTPAYSHGVGHDSLSTREQVLGRARAVQVQVLLTDDSLARLRQLLQSELRGLGLRTWAVPLAFTEVLA